MSDWTKPVEVDDVDVAFPASVQHLMPSWEEIPDEFKRHRGNVWAKLASKWFFEGLPGNVLVARPGIDRSTAIRHLKCVLGSYEPQHEHKEAAVAYLMSLWLEAPVDYKDA
jgi:hypothetical protein